MSSTTANSVRAVSVNQEFQISLNIRGRRVKSRGDLEREWKEREAAWQRAERAEADRRARELLDRHLTPEQVTTWRRSARYKLKYFDLTTQYGKQVKIIYDNCYNVIWQNWAYCAGPREVPFDDFILAQLLVLKYAEDEFWAVANREPVSPSLTRAISA